jgi:hypothetical protein
MSTFRFRSNGGSHACVRPLSATSEPSSMRSGAGPKGKVVTISHRLRRAPPRLGVGSGGIQIEATAGGPGAAAFSDRPSGAPTN